MPIKPRIATLTNSSVDILNAIRNSASTNYRDYVPVATPDAESIREIGGIIMDMPALQNEFLSALVNRIGYVMLKNRLYSNPWAMFKQGFMEFGETIEEIFVDLAKPFQYDPSVAETELFKREIPDVRSAFHIMNYQTFYKATVQQNTLKLAFLSWDGVTSLIAKIVDAMYTAAAYDEFQTMKYMLAKQIINGRMYPVEISPVTDANMKSIASAIKGASNDLTFLSDKYNVAGVSTSTDKNEQYLILNTKFDATFDVEVLASAFNMNKADFAGHRVLVDGFGNLDIERLNLLFANDPTYEEIGSDVLEALNAIPAVIVDREFFMIFDNLINFTENYNGQGLYWNYFYHTWKTFSVSPFANTTMFIAGAPNVTAVVPAVTQYTLAQRNVKQTIQLEVDVTTENFAPKSVDYFSDTEGVTVSKSGLVTIPADFTGVVYVMIKSTYKPDVTDTVTINVGVGG